MSADYETLVEEAATLLGDCRRQGIRLATAESCTGGLIAALLTEVPGSSDVFERGFVTYSNASKSEMIGVAADLIEEHGAVSEAVARAMAEGALTHAHVEVAVAVTGIAGPGGGSDAKPVGLVHLAVARAGKTHHNLIQTGDIGRGAIRLATARAAFNLIRSAL